MEEIHFSSWLDFCGFLSADLFKNGKLGRGDFLFRGQGNSEWPLTSSFDRAFTEVDAQNRDRLESDLIEAFKREFESDSVYKELLTSNKEQEILALAQHFGLPTRLLDWTESPYTAAFFAFSNRFESTIYGSPLSDDVAIWVIKTDHYVWKAKRGVSLFRPSAWDNIRLFRQSGWFTYTQTPSGNLAEFISEFKDADDALVKIVIDKSAAKAALADLDMMGVNHALLFDDHSARSRAAITKTFLNFKNS